MWGSCSRLDLEVVTKTSSGIIYSHQALRFMNGNKCGIKASQAMSLYARPDLILRGRCIRVVRLSPSNEPRFGIRLKMRIVDLDSSDNDYSGLFYMWGEELPARIILVNGIAMSARRNLIEFLIEMQIQKEECWFWIDAVH